jgi:hypothetical protein
MSPDQCVSAQTVLNAMMAPNTASQNDTLYNTFRMCNVILPPEEFSDKPILLPFVKFAVIQVIK